ncbi:MAG: hypothetical protein DMF80_06270 [Acidobacteria bacterium]|nr:MAG: hypothetical protein DMF80_06270 [Acidobacteriota bacterium]PYQ25450.1 MAG: hypothetical protein DMF81_02135 [Acidobacteriota bacterium]
MRALPVTCALVLRLSTADVHAAPQAAPPAVEAAPVVRSLEVRGATVYDLKAVQRILRVKPGGALRQPAPALAALLENRYHILGFPGARVEGRFDPATGTLSLTVDEGRLAAVDVEGLEGETKARVLKVLDLRTGKAVQERDISGALARLEKTSGGAFASTAMPPYEVEPGPEGVKLVLHLRRRVAALQVRPGASTIPDLYNRVDGLNLGANVRLTLFDPVSFDHAEVYAGASYGFAAEKVRYAVGALKPFGPRRQAVVGYEHHDFTATDDAFRGRTVESPPGLTLYTSIFEDYYRRRGHEAYAFVRPTSRFQLGAAWRSDDYESLPVAGDDSFVFSRHRTPNPPVAAGRMRSILATARWSGKRDLFENWPGERTSLLQRNPYGTPFERGQQARVEATWEVASPGLGGDFSFRRFIGQARAAHVFSPRRILLLRGLAGVGSGDVPPQRTLALGGAGTLRGYALKQFAGDRAVLGTAEYWLYPASPWPGLVFFYDGGTAWTRGRPRPGWKSDLGLGLDWPGGGPGYVRLDVGFPLDRGGSGRRARVYGQLRFPF